MTGSVRLFYTYFISIVAILFSIEAALEYRHYNHGYTTPLFGKKEVGHQTEEKNKAEEVIPEPQAESALSKNNTITYEPIHKFPFDKRIKPDTDNNDLRVWIASASHAVAGRMPVEFVFPNLLCEVLNVNETCYVINGSDGGMSISQNVDMIKEYASTFNPDYAVLYQMSMEIGGQQRRLIEGDARPEAKNTGVFDFSELIKLYQSLSLYGHLMDYIGGSIKLSGQLKQQLPLEMAKDFKQKIESFVVVCRNNNIEPVLSTFAISHNKNNIDKMRYSARTDFVKFSAYLSPDGWINMVDRYNVIVRGIAAEQNLRLVEIDKILSGKSQYFIDFVHFNKEGHRKVAEAIASQLNEDYRAQVKH